MILPSGSALEKIYGESTESAKRFQSLAENFKKQFSSDEMEFFTSPGRTETVGNHTDHNGGKILAASIDMDTVGAAHPNGTNTIRIVSEGYGKQITVDIDKVDSVKAGIGTEVLVAGMVQGTREFGFQVSGFDAYVSSNVIGAAGVSSSASFEMLMCSIINYFFNDGRMTYPDYARIGQYAENHFWNKSSGLMDQMACAVGGPILLDFAEGVHYEKVEFSFKKMGYDLVIVNTGKGHGDLSEDYSEVPAEMKAVAKELGAERLCESSLENLLEHLPQIEEKLGNDRAVLRALHFYEENRRVEDAAKAVQDQDVNALLQILTESGNSSWKWLQNCYTRLNYKEQKVSLTLALTELFLKEKKDGCCRVHGGGFAGVIMGIIPCAYTDEYVEYIAKYVGRDNVYPMNIRQTGAVHIEK